MSDDRTLQPTTRRRRQARSEGRIAVSSEVVGAAIWIVVAVSVYSSGDRFLHDARGLFQAAWRAEWTAHPHALSEELRNSLISGSILSAPLLLLVFAAAVGSRLAQVGFLWAPTRLMPDLSRVSGTSRIREAMSIDKLMLIVRGAALVACLLGLAGWGVWIRREDLLKLTATRHLSGNVLELVSGLCLQLGMCVAVFALLDYAYRRYRFERGLWMSPEEARAEVKAVEGNPQVAAGQRRMHHNMRDGHITTME